MAREESLAQVEAEPLAQVKAKTLARAELLQSWNKNETVYVRIFDERKEVRDDL